MTRPPRFIALPAAALLAGCLLHADSSEVREPPPPAAAAPAPAPVAAAPAPASGQPATLLAVNPVLVDPSGPPLTDGLAAALEPSGARAVALPPAPTVPRVGPACARPSSAPPPAVVRLSDLQAHARRVVAGHAPGAPVCDGALLGTVQALVRRLAGVAGRGQLPFPPGGPRRPIVSGRSSYGGGDAQLADADLTLRDGVLGHVERSLIVVDGNVRIGFLTDSIVVATGDVDVAHVDSSVVIAGGWLEVSHAGSQFGRGQGIPNVLVSGAWLRTSFAYGAVLAAPDGMAISHDQGAVRVGAEAMAGVVLSAAGDAAGAAGLGATVAPGEVPRVCVTAPGGSTLGCAVEGEELRDAGPVAGFVVSHASGGFVTLARGDERIRRVPTRDALLAPPARLALPPGAEIHGLGLYESGTANARVPVTVHRTAAPAVLVLKAYERVTWALALDPGVRLAGVVLSGYEPSRIVGVPDGVPVVRAFEQAGAPSTGDFHARGGVESAARAALGAEATLASYAGEERVGGFEVF